jgi:hypothetical protein
VPPGDGAGVAAAEVHGQAGQMVAAIQASIHVVLPHDIRAVIWSLLGASSPSSWN